MRIFVSIFLFFLFLTQTFSAFVLDGTYYFNQNFVAQNLCINKSKPQLHCNGKCYLAKQIARDGKGSALPAGNKKEREETFLSLPPNAISIATEQPVFSSFYAYNKLVFPPGFYAAPFQPPRSVCL